METSEGIGSILNSELQKIQPTGERRGASEFRSSFSRELWEFLIHKSSGIESTLPQQAITVEGKTGILPPPARRIIAKNVLAGSSIPALRESEEQIIADKPRREIEKASIHIFNEITPESSVNHDEIQVVTETLQAAAEIVQTSQGSLIEFEGEATDIHVAGLQASVHFIVRNAIGEYNLFNHKLQNSMDLSEIIAEYRKSITQRGYSGERRPIDDYYMYRGLVIPNIQAILRSDLQQPNISIPVMISPKEFNYTVPGNRHYTSSVLMHECFKDQEQFLQVERDLSVTRRQKMREYD